MLYSVFKNPPRPSGFAPPVPTCLLLSPFCFLPWEPPFLCMLALLPVTASSPAAIIPSSVLACDLVGLCSSLSCKPLSANPQVSYRPFCLRCIMMIFNYMSITLSLPLPIQELLAQMSRSILAEMVSLIFGRLPELEEAPPSAEAHPELDAHKIRTNSLADLLGSGQEAESGPKLPGEEANLSCWPVSQSKYHNLSKMSHRCFLKPFWLLFIHRFGHQQGMTGRQVDLATLQQIPQAAQRMCRTWPTRGRFLTLVLPLLSILHLPPALRPA